MAEDRWVGPSQDAPHPARHEPFNVTDDAVASVVAAFRITVRELCEVIDDLKRELKEKG
jgi:hypothetical protein